MKAVQYTKRRGWSRHIFVNGPDTVDQFIQLSGVRDDRKEQMAHNRVSKVLVLRIVFKIKFILSEGQ